MAAASTVESLRMDVTCPVCLEYFTDPMITPCGHNFCHTCLSWCWEGPGPTNPCPQCRAPVQQGPLLPNRQLANMVELVKQLSLQTETKRQKIVAKFLQLPQFLGEQERLLLTQLEKLDEETGRLQTNTELEEQVRGFSQKTTALSETLREFTDTPPSVLEGAGGKSLGAFRQAIVTLDPDTANPQLVLSEDQKSVKWEHERQPLLDKPERFDSVYCVLGREGFTSGRHCWEVEVGDGKDWAVGVARESVSRKGRISRSPEEGIWAVQWWGGFFQALTDPEVTPLQLSTPHRIWVCLDCDQGQVTFIDADAEALIFTFPPGSLPGERIRPWFCVGFKSQLQLSLSSASLGLTQPSL
ncbi:zinc finger protein RFP-like [Pelodiscus sinensis]|uniref:zinc finger protein RFP-like n=1 Tax=Pelodiscus sinensis TaxID=13735 RepID=UPI003F6C474A